MSAISDQILTESVDCVNTKPAGPDGPPETPEGYFEALMGAGAQTTTYVPSEPKEIPEPLAAGFKRTAVGHIKAPNGVLYTDPYFALTPEQQKALQNTPFGRPGGTGSNFVDCHAEEPPVWNVQDMIHEGVIAVIAGAGSVGKSLVAKHVALCCAGGISFLGKKCAEGKVLYINTEDPKSQNQRRIRRMLNGICRQVSTEKAVAGENWSASEEAILRAKILGNLTYINMCDDPGWSNYSPELIDEAGRPTEFYKVLKAYCDVFQPVLVVLDPLVYFLANENDNIEAKKVYHLIKRLGNAKTSYLAPHHQNKSSLSADNRNASEAARQTNSRGAGHLVMGAKFVAILEKNDKVDDANQLVIAKHNFCEDPASNRIPTDIILDRGRTDDGETWMLWRLSGESLADKSPAKPASKPAEPDWDDLIDAGLIALSKAGMGMEPESRHPNGEPIWSIEQRKQAVEAGRVALGVVVAAKEEVKTATTAAVIPDNYNQPFPGTPAPPVQGGGHGRRSY